MKKKLFIVSAILLIIVATFAISFAAWDNLKDSTILKATVGANTDIVATTIQGEELLSLVPKGTKFAKTKTTDVLTMGSVKLKEKKVDNKGDKIDGATVTWKLTSVIKNLNGVVDTEYLAAFGTDFRVWIQYKVDSKTETVELGGNVPINKELFVLIEFKKGADEITNPDDLVGCTFNIVIEFTAVPDVK